MTLIKGESQKQHNAYGKEFYNGLILIFDLKKLDLF